MIAQDRKPAAIRILVVDDEPDLCTLYELTLLREGYQVDSAGSLAEARHLLQGNRYGVVITDMRLPDGEGLALLQELAAAARPERSIVITAYGSAENAVEALKSGAFDYLTKPVDLAQFRNTVRAALQAPAATHAQQHQQPHEKREADHVPPPVPAGDAPENPALALLVGESEAMRAVKRRIVKVARSMAPVLIHGESGTGKELVARAVHACSHRGTGPFIPVNCGAIPENLLEAEFFGARKGSYTGATQDRKGFFQAAAGGTLFLDEIGDLPLPMQAKLLRAIQERKARPLGATEETAVDVRIVSATHKSLPSEAAAGRFRQDLLYRLNVIAIEIPPLRERREDIPAIARALLKRIAAQSGLAQANVAERQLERICNALLPGNVRELENLLHRAVALGDSDSVLGSLPEPALDGDSGLGQAGAAPGAAISAVAPLAFAAPQLSRGSPQASALDAWLAAQERTILLQALREAGMDATAAAASLGLSPRQLGYRLQRLGMPLPGLPAHGR